MRTLLPLVMAWVSLTAGCPGDSGTGDTGAMDTGARDTSAPDTSALDTSMLDTGLPDTGGGGDDTGTTDGGATDGGGAMCPSGLGVFCEGAPGCDMGYECNIGRCAPQGRPLCGGFAGALCTEPAFPSCLYFRSADFGPCLTAAEAACICGDPSRAAGFVCP